MTDKEKIVFFDKYCTSCKHEAVEENEEPCSECLYSPVNTDTHKPVKWEERK